MGLGFFKMSRPDKADTEFSLYIRERDNWTCQRCGRKWPENSQGLDCSHFWGRGRESTRFDPDNCDAFCKVPCHSEWENEKGETKGFHKGEPIVLFRPYKEWKINQLGEHRFAALEVRAHQTVKKDRKMALLRVKLMRKSLPVNRVVGERE